MPALLGASWVKQVTAIITDGDAQEMQQLDVAIKIFFTSATRICCGWHIVDRGWARHCPSRGNWSIHAQNRKQYSEIISIIQAWLYSWMKPAFCETEEEYNISKPLIVAYLIDDTIRNILGNASAQRILEFIRQYIEPHEMNYCYFLRKAI
jgi:hypothetical protein